MVLQSYELNLDGPLLRRQRLMLLAREAELRDTARLSAEPGELDAVLGLIELTDELADQAHDKYGIDCLLTAAARSCRRYCLLSLPRKHPRRNPMANNYLEFSEVIPHLTEAERDWLREQLTLVYVFDGQEYQADELPAGSDPADATWTGCRAYRDMPDYDPDFGDEAGFAFEFVIDEPDSSWGRHLWLYAEESACLDRVAHFVQKFLKQFRPHECWSLTYATVCSQPRVGEFGGGAVFVTAAETQWNDSYDFIERQRALFAAQSAE